jgi:hypothetical protein
MICNNFPYLQFSVFCQIAEVSQATELLGTPVHMGIYYKTYRGGGVETFILA